MKNTPLTNFINWLQHPTHPDLPLHYYEACNELFNLLIESIKKDSEVLSETEQLNYLNHIRNTIDELPHDWTSVDDIRHFLDKYNISYPNPTRLLPILPAAPAVFF